MNDVRYIDVEIDLKKNRENDYHFYKINSWKLKLVTFQ